MQKNIKLQYPFK